MRPRFRWPRDVFSLARDIRVFSFKLGRAPCHFSLFCNDGRYSCKHLFQNRSARNCTCLHVLWWNWSALPNEPGDKQVVVFCIMKWEGVIGWRSCGPSDLAVSAHPFISHSTSVSNVCKTISVTIWIPVRDFRTIARSSRRLKTPFALSLKLFTLNLMLVPLFGTFSQLSFTTHKIGTSVTPQLDHLAAKIYESSKTHTIIKSLSGPTQDESHVCSGTWISSTVSLYPLQAWRTKGQKGPFQRRKVEAGKPSCNLSEELPFVGSLAWHEMSCRQYIGWEQSKLPSCWGIQTF